MNTDILLCSFCLDRKVVVVIVGVKGAICKGCVEFFKNQKMIEADEKRCSFCCQFVRTYAEKNQVVICAEDLNVT